MKLLTVSDVTFLHDGLIATFGGSMGIRDDGLLESAVLRCQASFGGRDLYPTVFEKAAAIFHGVIFDHAFIDGNKRTAFTCAVETLERNGWRFMASNEEAVEKTRPDISEIASWLKKHSRKIKK